MIYKPRAEIVILGAARTPQGPLDGAVGRFKATELGTIAIAAALTRAGVTGNAVDEVVMGNVISAGLMQAPAKQAASAAGIPQDRPSKSINTVCGSGMSAIFDGCLSLEAGLAQTVVAGGMESRTNAPYLLGPFGPDGKRLPGRARGADYKLRFPRKAEGEEGHLAFLALLEGTIVREANFHDSLSCPFRAGHAMKDYAEGYAKAMGLTIEEVNAAAADSYCKARAAGRSGALAGEITPAGDVALDDIVSEEREADLRSMSYGHVTAYNAPALGDGASAVVLALRKSAEGRGLKPLAQITGICRMETAPEGFLHAPVDCVKALREATGQRATIIEANESFGLQMPVFRREFGADEINPYGGAVAITHPVGASGSRVVVTLLNAMTRLGHKHGAATICYGSGGAIALMLERL
jgi:acetyl-CoA C-acetyltransferase